MVSALQPPTSISAERRTMHMVPCVMMASASFRCTMPMSKKPMYSRSEEHTSELQSLMRISYAVFCLKKKKKNKKTYKVKHRKRTKYTDNIKITVYNSAIDYTTNNHKNKQTAR